MNGKDLSLNCRLKQGNYVLNGSIPPLTEGIFFVRVYQSYFHVLYGSYCSVFSVINRPFSILFLPICLYSAFFCVFLQYWKLFFYREVFIIILLILLFSRTIIFQRTDMACFLNSMSNFYGKKFYLPCSEYSFIINILK